MPTPADQWIDGLGPSAPIGHLPGRVMAPDEAAAFMAGHPDLSRRVEEHGRELAREYGSRLAAAHGLVGTADVAVDGATTGPENVAREEVGGLLGYILSSGATGLLGAGSEDGDGAGAADRAVEVATGEGLLADEFGRSEDLDGLDGPALDW